MTRERPVVEFCHHIEDGADPYAAWAAFRSDHQIGWCERFGGYWLLSRYDDVTFALRTPSIFSTARSDVTGDASTVSLPSRPIPPLIPHELDPPDALPYRRLLNGILSPAAVTQMRDRARHWMHWHIDQFVARGECDLVDDFTSPVTGAVTCEWLGFPREDWKRISRAQHDSVSFARESSRAQRAFADLAWTAERVSEEIGERLARRDTLDPDADVMSYLVLQRIDGEPIRREMVEAMVRLLISGGVDTTSASATAALVHLQQHPEHRRALADDPELWETAVDELLRRYPAVLGHARTILRDVEIRGCRLRAGERAFISDASACHDEDHYEAPLEVRLDRTPNRHVAFGLGTHRCAGLHLARVLLRDMIEIVHERIPDVEIDETQLRRYAVQSAIAGWQNAPARFTPAEPACPP